MIKVIDKTVRDHKGIKYNIYLSGKRDGKPRADGGKPRTEGGKPRTERAEGKPERTETKPEGKQQEKP